MLAFVRRQFRASVPELPGRWQGDQPRFFYSYTLYVHHGYGHLDYVVLIYRHGLRCTYSLLYTLLVLLRDTLPRCLTYVVVHPVPPRHYPVCLVYHFLSSVTTRRGVTDIHTLSCVALSPPAHPRSRSSIEIVLDGVVLDGGS